MIQDGESQQPTTKTYHLYHKKSKIMLAELISQDPNQMVHNHPLKENHGYFKIKSVYLRSAMKWENFDRERHTANAFIQWSLKSAKQRMIPNPSSKASDKTGPKEVERGRARWRKSDPKVWKIEKRQLKRLRGESYSPPGKKGQLPKPRKKAREMKSACNCRMKCHEHLSEEDRVGIFNKYWSLGDRNKQTQYILNNMKREATARTRRREGPTKSGKRRARAMTNTYYLKHIQVCKTMFHNTLDVSETYVKTCWEKSENGISNPVHKLEEKTPNHKLDAVVVESILDHIKSFPEMESHYLRAQYKEKHSNAAFTLPSSQSYALMHSWFSLPHPTLVLKYGEYSQKRGRKRLQPNSSLTIIRSKGKSPPCRENSKKLSPYIRTTQTNMQPKCTPGYYILDNFLSNLELCRRKRMSLTRSSTEACAWISDDKEEVPKEKLDFFPKLALSLHLLEQFLGVLSH